MWHYLNRPFYRVFIWHVPLVKQDLLTLQKQLTSAGRFWRSSCCSVLRFLCCILYSVFYCCILVVFGLFIFAKALSVHRRLEYPFGIVRLSVTVQLFYTIYQGVQTFSKLINLYLNDLKLTYNVCFSLSIYLLQLWKIVKTNIYKMKFCYIKWMILAHQRHGKKILQWMKTLQLKVFPLIWIFFFVHKNGVYDVEDVHLWF